MTELEFQNFTELSNFIIENNVEQTPVVEQYLEVVKSVGVGCGCSKKARISKAEAFYISLSRRLDLTAQDSIKDAAMADTVRFFHNESLFFEF